MPYNPGIQDRSGEFIGAGLAAGASKLASFGIQLGQAAEQQKEKQATEAKQAKSLRTYFKELDPDNKDRFETMNLEDLQGHGMALAGQQQKQKDAAKAEQDKSIAAYHNAQAGLMGQQLKDAQRAAGIQEQFGRDVTSMNAADQPGAQNFMSPEFLQNYGQQQAPQASGMDTVLNPDYLRNFATPPAPPRDNMMEAIRRNPNILSPAALGHLYQASQDAGANAGSAEFVEDPVSGSRYVKYRHSIMPSGQNPDKASNVAETIYDGEGPDANAIGHAIRDPKGRITFRPMNKEATVTPVIDKKTGKVIPDLYMDSSGKILDRRTKIERDTGMNPFGSSLGGAPQGNPKDPLNLFR